MSNLNISYRNGFPWGMTAVTTVGEHGCDTGIAFSILKLQAGEERSFQSADMEVALLQLSGSIAVAIGGELHENRRGSLFDEAPFAVQASCRTPISIYAASDAEIALFETQNACPFPFMVYPSDRTINEHRGKGLVGDCSLRYVRTIFDGGSSHPDSNLVLGEVVNFPGRWSSYPPHHHPQPEIYHYRFTDPRGYGHAELGEEVFKVRQYDTLKILNGKDHAQCSAPGYGMYYLWVIRHLEGARYEVPDFTEEHRWIMDPAAVIWSPKNS